MPLEFVPTPQPKSLESLKVIFKDRLGAILYKQLTVENIETFADEALSETVSLTDNILKEYKNNPEFNAPTTALNTKEQEDEAFRALDLQNIPDVLRQIIDKKEQISILKTYINKNIEKINEVITPPQPVQGLNIEKGNGSFERKKIFSRLLTLLYILEHDFNIAPTPERVPIKEGTVTPNMMRKTPYIRVEIPELERVVYICEEENNVSHVFDTKKLAEKSLTLEEIDIYNKEDKDSLIIKYPGIGIRIIQSKNWRTNIKTALEESISEIQKETIEKLSNNIEKTSEFREKKVWLSFEDFQVEVQNAYKGERNVQKWYTKEKKDHLDWPAAPYEYYKDKGWINWSELVGKENPTRKNFMLFRNFQTQVRFFYKGQASIRKWYDDEKRNHPDWPYSPDIAYKNKGWKGWPELVEKENILKKTRPSLSEFRTEVLNSYPGQGNINEWYSEERKSHHNWPAAPHLYYKNKGWKGWLELLGKKH